MSNLKKQPAFKFVLTPIAVVLIVVGLIVIPMPIPFGALMVVSGLVILISASPTVALFIKGYRRKYPKLDKAVRKSASILPSSWQEILKRTDP